MFVYIDESGHPHPNDPHPRPVDVGVCLKREDVRQITGALHRFGEDFRAGISSTTRLRGAEREGKAVAFLSRKALLGWPAKRVYADSVMDLIRNLDLTIFAMVMERPDRPIYRGEDHLLADFCAYILRVYYECGLDRQDPRGDPYLTTIKRYAEIIRRKTFDREDEGGGRSWGIRTMGKEHFFYKG